MEFIKEELRNALWEQITHENTNANIYLYIASFLKNKGFENIAKIFEKQYGEELSHAKMIVDLLTDMNTTVVIGEISEINLGFSSILDIAKKYLERELLTTASLAEIKNLAIDENPIVEERIREMIKLQQHEMSEVTDFYDKSEILGDDWKAVLLWDASLD